MWEACDRAGNVWTRPLDCWFSFCSLLHWIGFLYFASTPFLVTNITITAGFNCVITVQHTQYLFFFEVTKMRYLKGIGLLEVFEFKTFPVVCYYMRNQPQLLNMQHSHILLQFSGWSPCFAKVLLYLPSRNSNYSGPAFLF